jgi:bifunctional UDP-N-acetylglucosamine pyrophosphorylase/glucosamine-1-phosphate N-acetyltransferase
MSVPEVTSPLHVAILAAGKGTRMHSATPKVLHRLGSLTLLERVVATTQTLKPQRCFVVVGHAQDQIRAALEGYPVEFVEQREQKGTGHAVQQLLPHLLGSSDSLLVINADVPLLQEQTLRQLVALQQDSRADATLLTAHVQDPTGYGRVFCDETERVIQIVEHKDCSPEQRLHHRINGGVYCFAWPALAQILPKLNNDNQQGEYYLTDCVTLLTDVQAVDVMDPQEILGVNDRVQLSQAYQVLQTRLQHHWMRQGVTLLDPSSTTIEESVQLEADVVIEPQTHLRGKTMIRSGARIGPGSFIENSKIGHNCRVLFSTITDSQIGDHTTVGPYAHIRGQSLVADHCRIGNFVELKNTTVQTKSNAAHLSYLGDATLGEQVNIGAGTITANFDGTHKHPTVIGDRSKTGSNTVLVAPLIVGKDVNIGAGSTITADLPDDCLAIARARQVVKPGWRKKEKSLVKKIPVAGIEVMVLRLPPDQDLKDSLQQITHEQGVQAGFILSAVGSLKQVTLRLAHQDQVSVYSDYFEIVSLVGSLSLDGLHLHMGLADQQGQTLGGHVEMGCLIYTTVEIMIGISQGHRFRREFDALTGYHELVVECL